MSRQLIKKLNRFTALSNKHKGRRKLKKINDTWARIHGQIMDANDAQTIELLKKEQADINEACEEIRSILNKHERWAL